ncbi:MAG: toll/interleukin-1 receptor domain-containing protein [Ignavibacteria bacterium]|nr:toll/interleukin-1 receptor domain-containing protein [Ignavibacteria bacterium]
MRVFISHSMKDTNLLDALRSICASTGITPLIAEHSIELQHTITEKIERMIDGADLVVVALTKDGFDSQFVQQEIGYAKKAKKPFLLLVEEGLQQKLSGFVYGRDFITVNPMNLGPTLEKIKVVLSVEKQQRDRVTATARQQAEARENFAKLLLLIIAFIFLAGLSKS